MFTEKEDRGVVITVGVSFRLCSSFSVDMLLIRWIIQGWIKFHKRFNQKYICLLNLISFKGKIISEKCARLKKIFQICSLNYFFQYMALTKCKL